MLWTHSGVLFRFYTTGVVARRAYPRLRCHPYSFALFFSVARSRSLCADLPHSIRHSTTGKSMSVGVRKPPTTSEASVFPDDRKKDVSQGSGHSLFKSTGERRSFGIGR